MRIYSVYSSVWIFINDLDIFSNILAFHIQLQKQYIFYLSEVSEQEIFATGTYQLNIMNSHCASNL